MGASRVPADRDDPETGELSAAHGAFSAEVRRLRLLAGLSQKSLARRIGCNTSYVSKMECGAVPPTVDFARLADDALRAGGDLVDRWQTWYELRRRGDAGRQTAVSEAINVETASTTLLVTHERTTLSFDGDAYAITVLRELENRTERSYNGYEVRIHVDAFPDDVERSRVHHRAHPLVWDHLGFRCWWAPMMSDLDPRKPGAGPTIELVADPTQTVTDKMIEGWIRFEGKRYGELLTLHPGRRLALMYSYTVSSTQWGTWYQRRMRVPTRRLDVELDFPQGLRTLVWGKAITAGDRIGPLGSQIDEHTENGRSIWSWTNGKPEFGDRYRFEWRFGNPPSRQPEEHR
ncbi:helix-turn-helix transcriptional regulator [Dactylosporangium roseum]|uniref:helix-turn-helix domain-containing protein n=1 Tax=Dactylosporangium roseum TaxID=47989 RepID=UPI0031D1E4C2